MKFHKEKNPNITVVYYGTELSGPPLSGYSWWLQVTDAHTHKET